jgi:carbonic anhydrase
VKLFLATIIFFGILMNALTLKHDVPAGIVVFLVALPLCLGIALASGAPLFSGIISGIIGGIVVGLISGSQTSVSGPAAGLAAVVLASITKLGAFELLLVAVVIAGVLQLAMGFFRTGFIANYIPSNVIKGLLAAIGILLILKQIPHAFGYDLNKTDDSAFIQANGENTFSAILHAFDAITPGALAIGLASMLILLMWDKTPLKKFKLLPAPLVVVGLGVVLHLGFNRFFPAFSIEATHLVDIPSLDIANLGSYVQLPDLAHFANPDVWIVGATIAIVASLETLLNIEAVDKLDPHKRETPPNRELLAQGVGNICAGLLGGLPVTSVIVRSSVNIQNDNKTKASAVLHGVLLLASVLLLAPALNLIPLAALAAILIATGYKLAKLSLFCDMYRQGWSQFMPFAITVAAIVLTDLLTGVLVGLAASMFFLMRSNFRNPYSMEQYRLHIGDVIKLELPNQVSFLNKATIKSALWDIPQNANVLIDASNTDYIDHDVLETLQDYRVVAAERNIRLNVIGLRQDYSLQDTLEFVPALDKDTRDKLRPDDVLQLLRDGNERFREGRWTKKYYLHQVEATAGGQHPMAVVVNCIDSRTSPEIIFDAGLGDLPSASPGMSSAARSSAAWRLPTSWAPSAWRCRTSRRTASAPSPARSARRSRIAAAARRMRAPTPKPCSNRLRAVMSRIRWPRSSTAVPSCASASPAAKWAWSAPTTTSRPGPWTSASSSRLTISAIWMPGQGCRPDPRHRALRLSA